MAHNKYSQWLMSPWGLFVAYVSVTFLKAHRLFTAPRFWAEDGVVYFLQARTHTLSEAMWAMPLGYLSLPANLAGMLSAQLPLLYAPYGNLAVALSIQMLLFWVVFVNRLLDGDRLKQGILLFIPVLVIQSAETWLNAINSQFWLALAAAYVLASPGEGFSVKRHAVNSATLLLAGLSGPVSAFLAPLFVLRGIAERRWVWLAYALPVSLGALIVLTAPSAGARTLSFPMDIFAIASLFQIFVNNVCVECALVLYPHAEAYSQLFWLALLILLGGYTWAYFRANRMGRWLILASSALLVLSFVGMLGKEQLLQGLPYMSSRYFFAPASLFFAAMLCGRDSSIRGMASWALILLSVNGLYFGTLYHVVGERDGRNWKRSVRAYLSSETDVVYFNQPLCGFAPELAKAAPTAPNFITGTASELIFQVPEQATLNLQNVYLYRAMRVRPQIWQRHDGDWRDSGMFLIGAPHIGQCYGGDGPDPIRWVRIADGRLYLSRTELGALAGYTFMLGYGENFGAMLARRSFIQFNGDDLEPRLPPLAAGNNPLVKTK